MNTIKVKNGKTLMVAHRGCSCVEKENSLAAFIAAGNRSYYGIETDVHRTADGEYVCIHDSETARVASDNIVIEKTSFEYIRSLKLCDIDGTRTRNDIRIPTLREYIRCCKRYEKHCVLELKTLYTYENVCEIIDQIIEEDYLEHVTFISFAYDNLLLVKRRLPDQPCQYLVGEYTDDLPQKLADDNMGLDIWYGQINEQNLALLHGKGVEVNVWTCDDPSAAEALINMGVDYITSNRLEGTQA